MREAIVELFRQASVMLQYPFASRIASTINAIALQISTAM